MTSRRRNLFVILLMLGLLAASAVVIVTKQTKLGLDLKGGVELVYQGEPTPQSEVTPGGDRPRDRHHPRARRPPRRRRARDPAPRLRPDLGRPAGRQEPRAREEAGRHDRAALLLRLGAQRHRQPAVADRGPLPGGQARLRAEAGQGRRTTRPTGTYYLFKPNKLLAAGPDASRKDLLSEFDGRVPKGYEILRVPAGHRRAAGRAAREPSRRRAVRAVLRPARQPRAERHGPQGPASRSSTRRRSEPIVTFKFTDKGRKNFQDVTRRLAERGQTAPDPGPAGRRARSRPSRSCSTARSSRGRSSTTARTRTASTAAPARRSPAASRSRRRRTSPTC